jgi:hypothetical protein
MKADVMLIKKILLVVEGAPTFKVPIEINIFGETIERIDWHIEALLDNDLILAEHDESGRLLPVRMTFQGHDYLDKLNQL